MADSKQVTGKSAIDRRHFLGTAIAGASVMGCTSTGPRPARTRRVLGANDRIHVGVIGTGNRGRHHIQTLLTFPDVEVPAVCDINEEHLKAAQRIVTDRNRAEPKGYSGGPHAYRDLLDRNDLDAIVIGSPWDWHAPMSVDAMKAGKVVGTEVPAAITMDECWDLINTYEKTRVPCMMLENWSFRSDNLAVLNMIRKGMLGEMVHVHCAHSHDCIDHWFFDTKGNDRWPARFLIERNCDQYPTHSLGPVLSWLDINCGDTYDYLTATATDSRGINAYFARKFGPDHPGAKRKYKQGDIVTSTIRTKKGRSIVINYDMQLPRPYDNRWLAQGTLGVYNEQRNSVYLAEHSPQYHQWEPFPPYQQKYEHEWYQALKQMDPEKFGHGGTDYLELQQFLKAVRNNTQTPIDVYDSVMMSVITPLSEMSIAAGGKPIPCPDFTKGAWQTRKPTFAIEGA